MRHTYIVNLKRAIMPAVIALCIAVAGIIAIGCGTMSPTEVRTASTKTHPESRHYHELMERARLACAGTEAAESHECLVAMIHECEAKPDGPPDELATEKGMQRIACGTIRLNGVVPIHEPEPQRWPQER